MALDEQSKPTEIKNLPKMPWKLRIGIWSDNIVIGFFIIMFAIFAHTSRPFLWVSGLKIKYINHAPWPYRKIWNDFKSGFSNSY